MNITSVRIRKMDKEGSRKKGIATIVIDNALAIHDIKIIEGDRGLFVAMPSRKNLNGEMKDVAHPISAEAREELEKAVIEAYNNTEDELIF